MHFFIKENFHTRTNNLLTVYRVYYSLQVDYSLSLETDNTSRCGDFYIILSQWKVSSSFLRHSSCRASAVGDLISSSS